MKDAEIDWLIYHQINSAEGSEIRKLAEANDLPENIVEASLERLERKLLVERRERRVHLLSINESLIRCQIKFDPDLPFSLDNGVIKTKKR